MSFLKKFDPFAIVTSSSAGQSRASETEEYMQSLVKQRKKEKVRQQKLFEMNVKRQLQVQILKDVYGVKVDEEDNRWNGSIPMAGKVPTGSGVNSSNTPELNKGIGDRGNKGGFVNRSNTSQHPSQNCGLANAGGRLKRF